MNAIEQSIDEFKQLKREFETQMERAKQAGDEKECDLLNEEYGLLCDEIVACEEQLQEINSLSSQQLVDAIMHELSAAAR